MTAVGSVPLPPPMPPPLPKAKMVVRHFDTPAHLFTAQLETALALIGGNSDVVAMDVDYYQRQVVRTQDTVSSEEWMRAVVVVRIWQVGG